MILGIASWRQTWANHDNFRRLTIKVYVAVLFSEWYVKHPPVAFVFNTLDPSLQIPSQCPAFTSVDRYWQDEWHRVYLLENWWLNLVIVSLLLALSWLMSLCQAKYDLLHPPVAFDVLVPVWSLLPLMVFRPWFVLFLEYPILDF